MIMKKHILIFCTVLITMLICCSKDKYTEIPFTNHDPYYLLSTYEIDSIGRFFVIVDSVTFNNVFHPAGGMFEKDWIYPSYFNDSMVIAVCKRYVWHKYDIKIINISRSDGIIRVDYDYYVVDEDATYIGRGGRIVMIKKQYWDKVNFYENGVFIKQVTEPFQ